MRALPRAPPRALHPAPAPCPHRCRLPRAQRTSGAWSSRPSPPTRASPRSRWSTRYHLRRVGRPRRCGRSSAATRPSPRFNLEGNQVGSAGIEASAAALRTNCTLREPARQPAHHAHAGRGGDHRDPRESNGTPPPTTPYPHPTPTARPLPRCRAAPSPPILSSHDPTHPTPAPTRPGTLLRSPSVELPVRATCCTSTSRATRTPTVCARVSAPCRPPRRAGSTIEEESTQRRSSAFGARCANRLEGPVVRTAARKRLASATWQSDCASGHHSQRCRAACRRRARAAQCRARSTLGAARRAGSAALSPRIDPVAVSPGSQAVVQTLLRQASHEACPPRSGRRWRRCARRRWRQRSRELVRARSAAEEALSLDARLSLRRAEAEAEEARAEEAARRPRGGRAAP